MDVKTQNNTEKAIAVAYEVANALRADVKLYEGSAELIPHNRDWAMCLHFERCDPDYDSGEGVPEKPVMEIEFSAAPYPLQEKEVGLLAEQLQQRCSDKGFYTDGFGSLPAPNFWASKTVPIDNPALGAEAISNMCALWDGLIKQSWDAIKVGA